MPRMLIPPISAGLWDSRFPRRVYIPLPGPEARAAQLKNLLRDTSHNLTRDDFKVIASKLDGYSGSDIRSLARDASYCALRWVTLALLTADGLETWALMSRFCSTSPCGQ